VADKNGDVWAGSMLTDRVVRLDPKTGRSVQYQLPADTNIRRVWVDNAKNPVELWIGNNHQGSIIRVQPLD
jgi:streptogramin lyase